MISSNKFTVDQDKAPREVCRFRTRCKFARTDDPEEYLVPVELEARGKGAIYHWYWGKVVHDFEGMEVHKDKLSINYRHDDDEVIGFIDERDTSDGLKLSGALVLTPNKQNDKAAEVAHKDKQGIPYEASIEFDDTEDGEMLIEYVSEGQVTQVNGESFEGPGIVIRKWALRGVAICPHGADRGTNTKTFSDESPSVALKVERMSTKQLTPTNDPDPNPIPEEGSQREAVEDGEHTPDQDTAPSEPEVKEEPSEPAVADQLSRTEGEKFQLAFGDQGLKWYFEGMSFEDAQKKFNEQQEETIKKLTDRVKALEASEGEEEPAKFSKTKTNGKKSALFPSK